MNRLARNALIVTLLAGLLGLEVAHAVRRFRALAARSAEEALANLRGTVSRQAARLEDDLALGKAHARYLASLDSVRSLLDGGSAGAFDEAARDAAAFLFHFPSFGGLFVLDASGNERLRVERMGGGVAVVPAGLLRLADDRARLDDALRLLPGEVSVSPLEFDATRIDVSERDRQVLRYAAPVRVASSSPGVLVLSLYAAPLFDGVRRNEPAPGVREFLIDASGEYLAHPERSREFGRLRGTGLSFRADFPAAFGAIVDRGEPSAGEGRDRFVAAPTGPRIAGDRPAWYLVLHAPPEALERAAVPFRAEAVAILLLLLATGAAVGAVGFVLLRLSSAQTRLERDREIERRLAEAERLAAIGRLTAGVAHEINNPLEGIGNYLALLDREGDRPEKRREHAEMLRHGFERIRTIVRDFLSVAHPPAPRREPVDLGRVLDRVERVARHDRAFRDIAWERRFAPDLPAVAGDPFALEQVFLNLALNARDAMGGRGRIAVEARSVPGNPASVEVHFEDSGPGIGPEVLPRIFEPFFSTRGGTGLGLSVSESIVRAHGGSLRAENRAEGGARFILMIPAATEAAPPEGTG